MLNRRLILGGALATAATLSAGLHTRPLLAATGLTVPRALIPAARANGWRARCRSCVEFISIQARTRCAMLVGSGTRALLAAKGTELDVVAS